MADHGDLQAHEQTYAGVMRLLKISTGVWFVVAMFIVFILAN